MILPRWKGFLAGNFYRHLWLWKISSPTLLLLTWIAISILLALILNVRTYVCTFDVNDSRGVFQCRAGILRIYLGQRYIPTFTRRPLKTPRPRSQLTRRLRVWILQIYLGQPLIPFSTDLAGYRKYTFSFIDRRPTYREYKIYVSRWQPPTKIFELLGTDCVAI